MLLLQARAVNACLHKDTTVEFGPGLTAISGLNGSGKSSFMHLVRSSLTNDFSALGGAKELNIRRDADDEEISYVETRWLVRAGEMTVRRYLRGGHSFLLLNGNEIPDLTGRERAITTEALTLAGTSAEVLNEFVFADYQALRSITAATRSQRAKLFTAMCGLGVIGKIDDAIRTQMAVDNAICEQFDQEALDEYRRQHRVHRKELRLLGQELGEITKEMSSGLSVSDLDETIEALVKLRDDWTKAYDDCVQAKDRIRKRKARLAQLLVVRQQLFRRDKTARFLKHALQLRVNQYTIDLQLLDRYNTAAEHVTRAKQALQIPAPQSPVDPHADASMDGILTQLSTAMTAIKRCHNELSLISKSGKGTCPTCGGSVDVSEKKLAALQAELKKTESDARNLQLIRDAKRTYEKELSDHRNALTKHNSQVEHAKQVIEQNIKDAEKAPSKSELVRLKALSTRRTNQLAYYDRECNSLQKHINETEAAILNCEDVIQQSKEFYRQRKEERNAVTPPSNEEITELKELRTRKRHLMQREAEINATIKSTRKQVEDLDTQIAKQEQLKSKLSRIRECTQVQQRAREICSRDRLPRRIVNAMLHEMTAKMNALLVKFSASFQVEVNVEQFSFTAVHQDGYRESAERLSTGQGLLLGIAFWLARTMLFPESLPLFCLDEPTANIDAARLVDIADLFANLAEELFSSNRQGIVITHHVPIAESATRQYAFGE